MNETREPSMKGTLIPMLNAATVYALPHAKAIGQTEAGLDYVVRRRHSKPKYMRLYVGDIDAASLDEANSIPGELGKIYESAARDTHPFLVEVTLGGQGLVDYCNETYAMRAGEFCFLDCCEDHFCRTDPEIGIWNKIWVYLAGPSVEFYHKAFLNANKAKCRAILGADSGIARNIRALYRLYTEHRIDLHADMRAAVLIADILSECVECADGSVAQRQTPDVVLLMKEYISRNYSERITLEILAERFALDKYYLQKLFTQYMSISPNEYLITTRMHRAKKLLCSTLLPVAEIGEMVGMDNTSYFIKQFRRREGMTPTKYRQMMQPLSKR